jgi:uncharacterized membrane protein
VARVDALGMLLHTVAMRPYVFIFLIAFLGIGIWNRGTARTLLLLAIGYVVAFVSEWASIRWGFPYGHYVYLYDALEGELVLGGVPVWDSLSYSFLAYAAYETYRYLGWRYPVLGAAWLMTWADVVVDPVALRGEQWFLGRVFGYTVDGWFFGVPLSNFAGWFGVGLAILWTWDRLERRLATPPPLRAPWMGPLFYYGILAFILSVAAAIGAWGIVATGAVLHAPVVGALIRKGATSGPPARYGESLS